MEKPVPISRWLRDWLLRIYCELLVLLALYVFSIGPMYWSIYEAYQLDGSPFLAKMYFPVVWVCENNEYVYEWVEWYVGLWIL